MPWYLQALFWGSPGLEAYNPKRQQEEERVIASPGAGLGNPFLCPRPREEYIELDAPVTGDRAVL